MQADSADQWSSCRSGIDHTPLRIENGPREDRFHGSKPVAPRRASSVGAVGHRSLSGTLPAPRHRRLADLPAQPDERHVQRRPQAVGDERVQEPVGAFGRGLGGIRPSRRETRCTCVSTGRASRPSAKLSTTAAVFGPMPGQRRQVVAGLAVGHLARATTDRSAPSRSRTSRRIAWIRGAFVLARPPDCGSRRRRARSGAPHDRRPSRQGTPAGAPRTPARRSGRWCAGTAR